MSKRLQNIISLERFQNFFPQEKLMAPEYAAEKIFREVPSEYQFYHRKIYEQTKIDFQKQSNNKKLKSGTNSTSF